MKRFFAVEKSIELMPYAADTPYYSSGVIRHFHFILRQPSRARRYAIVCFAASSDMLLPAFSPPSFMILPPRLISRVTVAAQR